MRIYHATKTHEGYEGILKESAIRPGRNVTTEDTDCAHVSLNPFSPGSWALDVIGKDTNEAWVFTLEIPDDTALEPDPSGDGDHYNGGWMVYCGILPVTIIAVEYIPNVQAWESDEPPN